MGTNFFFKVLHSQSLNLPVLKPWIVCEEAGKVLAAHCTCIAGLGECCSHVGALLFAVESVVRGSSMVKHYFFDPK